MFENMEHFLNLWTKCWNWNFMKYLTNNLKPQKFFEFVNKNLKMKLLEISTQKVETTDIFWNSWTLFETRTFFQFWTKFCNREHFSKLKKAKIKGKNKWKEKRKQQKERKIKRKQERWKIHWITKKLKKIKNQK